VINRGNYRRDIFESAGAANSFQATLGQTCERYAWRVHAYVIMRNHFHVALETPEPNLVDGMHWLQTTYASRFNRFRDESGHLFQGRYRALLMEDTRVLARVVNYIHLNPVRAEIVLPPHVAAFRWSSLSRWAKPSRPDWLVVADTLRALGLEDNPSGWQAYVRYLIELSSDVQEQKRQGFEDLSRGWAIGTFAWRQAVARQCSQLALERGFESDEIREIKETRWRDALTQHLRDTGRRIEELATAPKAAEWKIQAATLLRRQFGAPYRWIAKHLEMGSPDAVRVSIARSK
jgi:REP element-mobilizing transposase RayT